MSLPIDGTMDEYLMRSATPPLAAVVGTRLARVTYWCLQWKWTGEEINDPLFYTGGQVELEFANGADIYVSWKQNAVWRGDSGIEVGFSSSGRIGAYERLEANETPLWRPLIGDLLRRIDVLGWNLWPNEDDEVRVVRFGFSKGNVYVGVGHKAGDFSMGDDILVRSENDFLLWPDAKNAIVLWSSGEIE
ncbi:MAG: hypothetical protein ACR2JW_18880 [Thermomicrobiales bacterium]